MGGFAITIAAWLGLLSFAPRDWLDGIVGTSLWIYTLASMVSLVGLCGAHVLGLPPQPPAGFVNS